MVKNQDFGIAVCTASPSPSLGLELGLYEDIVPERAASMVKGREGLEGLKRGGSTRRKGLEEKRRLLLERRPTRLCLGEPRLWEMGVVVVLVGTETERDLVLSLMLPVLALPEVKKGELAGVVVDFDASTRVNLEALLGVPSMALLFLDGEKSMFGSIFSVSNSSSKGSGDRRRFIGELRVALDGEVRLAWGSMAIRVFSTMLNQTMNCTE